MRATIIHAPGDVRVEDRPDPEIVEPTDAIIRLTATCVCGSDLWPYRGAEPISQPTPMGHEYVGVVEHVGDDVTNVAPGDTVVGSFVTSDNTCEICQAGFPSSCVNRTFMSSTQAELARIPNADGTLVATPTEPHDDDIVRDLLAVSDVMGTGWWAATAAQVQPGDTVAVVGDGAVGLCGIIAAKQLGAERIIVMSRHEPRQALAREFGATDIVTQRGDEGAERVKELTDGLGAHATLECVGMQQSFEQAIRSTRPGGNVGYVGVPHNVTLDAQELFFAQIQMLGGPGPVRRFLPDLIDLVWKREIQPGKVFDLELPLDDAAEGYAAMDERRAIKALLRP
jgi:threonine dehydrogenase-like Zn-dependent dehydrogenase